MTLRSHKAGVAASGKLTAVSAGRIAPPLAPGGYGRRGSERKLCPSRGLRYLPDVSRWSIRRHGRVIGLAIFTY